MSSIGALALLAVPAAAGVTPAAVPMADAGLLRLCARFEDAYARSYAAGDNGPWEAWLNRRTDYADAIEDIVATTPAGELAKARVALTLFEEAGPDAGTDDRDRMVLSLLRDMVERAAA